MVEELKIKILRNTKKGFKASAASGDMGLDSICEVLGDQMRGHGH